MKIVRLLVISLFIFFGLFFLGSMIIPSHVRVSRAINLKPGSNDVMNQINDLNNWKYWYPQFEHITLEDVRTQANKTVQAKANGILLEITGANDSLVAVKFLKGERPVNISWKLISYQHSDSLTLQSYMDFDFKWYPWEKFSSLLLDKSYGPTMEQSLLNLKQLTNANQ